MSKRSPVQVRIDPRRVPRNAEELAREAVENWTKKAGVDLLSLDVSVFPQSSELAVQAVPADPDRVWSPDDRKALRKTIMDTLRDGWVEQEAQGATTAPGVPVPARALINTARPLPAEDGPRFHSDESIFEMGRNLERIRLALAGSIRLELQQLSHPAAGLRDWAKLAQWLQDMSANEHALAELGPDLRLRVKELLWFIESKAR